MSIGHFGFVHDRWNQDKHRVIHPTGIEIHRIEYDMQPGCRLAEVNTRTLKKGGKAFAIVCDPPKPGLKMHVEAEVKVVIQDPSHMRRGLNESWHGYFGTIGRVIERLLESIGQQAEAIPF
ncbi:MAG TPA: hypothetical protein VGR26_06570 [Acidimicrobiales bacterium]|nr:hypothetical protein [Acidimicrobiales bacterium]